MKLSLNKNSLKQQRDQLAMFRRFLPSLDLKRQQLLGALKSSRQHLEMLRAASERQYAALERLLPLLGSSTLETRELTSLVSVRAVQVEHENVVGTRVPADCQVQFHRTHYSTLAFPFWVDQLVEEIEAIAEARIRLRLQEARVEHLSLAARKITQRVNLFEKVLIPNALDNIKRIRVALADEERAAVVRSKLAKARRK